MADRVYFDACCLNRPFDDQTQPRIRLETEAVEHLLRAVEEGMLVWFSSEALLFEIHKCPDEVRRAAVLALCSRASSRLAANEDVRRRAAEHHAAGLRPLDALHLACAEAGGAQVLLTTDDRFVAGAARLLPASPVRVLNPIAYEQEVLP